MKLAPEFIGIALLGFFLAYGLINFLHWLVKAAIALNIIETEEKENNP